MSKTVEEAATTVRYLLRDRNPQSQAFSEPELVAAIQSGVRLVASFCLMGENHTAGLVAIQPNVSDYALPATQEYANLFMLRSQSDGLEIPIVSRSVFEAWRTGDTGQGQGPPLVASLYETPAGVLHVRVWPTPREADTWDGYTSLLPADFYTAGTFALAALPSSTSIPFDNLEFEALCYTVADELFNRMTDERKAANQLGPNANANWQAKMTAAIKASRHRRRRTSSGAGNYVARSRRW
jgi:hypothetical protein